MDALLAQVRPDDLIVDVGAHVGIFTVLMARAVKFGRVVAFEPNPDEVQLLERNIRQNQVRHVAIRAVIVSDQPGPSRFEIAKDGGFSSIQGTGRMQTASVSIMPATTLDLEFPAPARVGAVKIDVEGAELKVLRGGERILSDPLRRPRAVLVELSEENQRAYGFSCAEVISFMTARGYVIYSIRASGLAKGWLPSDASGNALFLSPEALRP